MKPMLAEDFVEDKLVGPWIAQPKVDGVRGMNMLGIFTGRSLKTHKNIYTTKFYSRSTLIGLDGEVAAELETHPDLCRITSSALSTIAGEPYTVWWLFDYVVNETKDLPYEQRLVALQRKVDALYHIDNKVWHHLRVMPSKLCHTLDELYAFEDWALNAGYEGICIRRPSAPHKQGRSTVREGGLLRIKRFVEAEAKVISLVEGETNGNEAQKNELGKTFRSSHQANMVPNGQVGSLTCELLEDIVDTRTKTTILQKGQTITVSPGNMDHPTRKQYFENPSLIVQKIIKFKFFPKGLKDKPRFPTFVTIRSKEDM